MFEELLKLSPDAVVIADAAGRIVELNPPAEEMFGFSRADLLGQSVEILVPIRFRSKHPAHRHNYIARPHTRPMGAGLQLWSSEQLFRSIVQGVKDYAIFTLDPEGKVASWNAGAEQIKGYKAEEIIGQHFSLFYTEDDIRRSKPDEELRTTRSRRTRDVYQ
jgi:PAS domain-containing protein